jgi:hypothetical protein
MKPGVVIWVLGQREKLGKAGAAVQAAVKDFFPFSIILSEEEARQGLCSGEPPGADVRALAARRMGWVCRLLERSGGAAIALSCVSKREERDAVRKTSAAVIEVLVAGAPPPDLEPPFYPEVELADGDGPEEVRAKVLQALKSAGLLDESSKQYNEDEEKLVKDRLEKLGYL